MSEMNVDGVWNILGLAIVKSLQISYNNLLVTKCFVLKVVIQLATTYILFVKHHTYIVYSHITYTYHIYIYSH